MPKEALDEHTQLLFDFDSPSTEEDEDFGGARSNDVDTEESEFDDDSGIPVDDPLPISDEGAGDPSADIDPDQAGEEAEGSPDGGVEEEAEAEPEDAPEDENEKVRQGLLRDLQKERREKAEMQAKLNTAQRMMDQPVAPAPQMTTHQAPQANVPELPGLPVQVTEDGQNVYIDRDMLTEEVQRISNAPREYTQAEISTMTENATREMYIGASANQEEANVRLAMADRANQANGFLAAKMQELASQGHQITSPAEGLHVMRQMGADKEFEMHFPEIAPMVDEFAETMTYGSPLLRSKMYERIAPEPAQSVQDDIIPPGPTRRVAADGPRSMAKKGGQRSTPKTAKQAQYEQMRDEFQRDIMGFPRSKFKEMKALGRELGIDADSEDEDEGTWS